MDIKPKTTSYLPSSRPSRIEQLQEITDVLLLSDNPKELNDTVLKLYSLLSAISGINDNPIDASDSLNSVLPVGEALSPRNAARCVIDAARTSKFLRGIYAALLEAQQRFPNGAIEILYAGCGPFAPLAIPLTTQFKADQIQFTLLDIHARSLESARHIALAFGVEDYVRGYIQSDAASYAHPHPPHMVITETMQKALSKEPQLAITLNLAPQLCASGIFIPQRVTIDANLCDPRNEFVPGDRDSDKPLPVTQHAGGARIKLGKVFDLTAEEALELARKRGRRTCSAEAYLPAAAIDLPQEIAEGHKLMLSTIITVFGMVTIGEYESGLTHPLWFYDFSGAKARTKIEFQYFFKGNPGFKWHMSE
ncbi:MAG TPA: hypothetical protein VJ464_01435 [Blastocatellia bacterium]|nr:hypothetical protein [Blastocatellia bacterium]